MKKTSLLLVVSAAGFICLWISWKSRQPVSTQVAPAVSAGAAEFPTTDGNPATGSPSSHQDWIKARSAVMEINQVVDPVIDEPVGTIRFEGASGTLGQTPPLYRLQLKTAKHPILLGEKDTRHHFVRRVTGVRVDGGKVVLVPEISISYPRSVSSGGIVFNAEED